MSPTLRCNNPRDWVEWAHAIRRLAGSAQITNTWQLGRVLKQWIDYFAMMGGYRARVELALVAGDLAVARQGAWQARLLADIAESATGELKEPGDIAERITALRTAADEVELPKAPGPQAELVGYFDASDGFNADPERWVEWLSPVSGKDLEATRRHTTTLGFLGYPAKGADIYWTMLVESGTIETADPQDASYLTGLLIEARQDERLEQMAERLPAPSVTWPSGACTARGSAGSRPRQRVRRRSPPVRASRRAVCGPRRCSRPTTTPRAPPSCVTSSTPRRSRARTSGG